MTEYPNEALELVKRAASQVLAPPDGYHWRKPVYGLYEHELTPDGKLWLHYCVKHQLLVRLIRIADGAHGHKHEYVYEATDDGRLAVQMGSTKPATKTPKESASAVEALLGEESKEILAIARSDKSASDRAIAICEIDRRHLAWDSPRWADLLRVSDAAIRKSHFWKTWRPERIAREREGD